jgi:hypothetical protein
MGGLWRLRASGSRARKEFFFEKKNQKTFVILGQWRFHQHGTDYQKVFARFFQKALLV